MANTTHAKINADIADWRRICDYLAASPANQDVAAGIYRDILAHINRLQWQRSALLAAEKLPASA